MPWHAQAMKDVVRCDKLRGAANELRSGDFRMGKPIFSDQLSVISDQGIGGRHGRRGLWLLVTGNWSLQEDIWFLNP
jgi:hypothetical protein